VTAQLAAIVQRWLEGVPLPAHGPELVDYARRASAPADVVTAIAGVPDVEYRRLDDVGRAIFDPGPAARAPEVRAPADESGLYPGREAYLDTTAEPGSIRDEKETLPYEQQLVRTPDASD